MGKSKYKQYLENLHTQFNVPVEILTRVIKEATGVELMAYKRIIAGEVNEVYDVSLSNGENVIVRIAREEHTGFKREKWALEKVASFGVPVPEFLLIDEIEIDKKQVKICVQKKIEGEPLERGTINYSKMDKGELRKIINQTGKILSKIHQVNVDGFGDLDENGRGGIPSFKVLMSEHVDQEEDYLKLAKDVGFDLGLIKAIFEVLRIKAKTAPDILPVLNHDDFGPKHIMVKDGQITGILDWAVVGHSPVNDFSRWSFWYEEIPLEWLMEGYENIDLFNKDFPDLLNWIKLNNSLSGMWWYYEKGHYEGVRDLKPLIQKPLDYFGK